MEGERAGGQAESDEERANRRVCALFDACQEAGSLRGTRDAALISVLYGAELGREHALRLLRSAYDERTGRLEPRRAGPVPAEWPPRGTRAERRAAGGPESDVRRWATDGARWTLDAWVDVRGGRPGALFCRLRRGAPDPHRPLSPRSVQAALTRWAEAAGVDGADVHAFRELYESPWWCTSPPG